MKRSFALVLALLSLPAVAQTTTTVTSQPQEQAPPPPPPSSSTTVTTQSSPPPPTTQVVVNPNDPNYVPPPPASARTQTQVQVDNEPSGVITAPSGRSAVAIIATDALYGGVAGALVGGGITLIDQGNNWARNLMVGAGIGILAGAGYGVYESATQPPARRAVADADPGVSNANGPSFALSAGRF
ncbi:MAG TPA: hypothetical protein VFE90_12585 [Myxococcales bacterium]|nr:hypothetical protein [Myxococcales bacterium]